MHRTSIDVRGLTVGWLLLIGLWCTASYVFCVPEYLLASPGRVGRYVHNHGADVAVAMAMTGSQAIAGWCVSLFLGVLAGAAIFYAPWGRRIVLSPLVALQTTPIIALAPLVTFLCGYGWVAKVVVVVVVASFPITLATFTGLSEAHPNFVRLFQLSGSGPLVLFWRVRLPSAWAGVLPAMKVAAVLSVIGSIVAEFMGGSSGLGFLIMKSVYNSRGDLLVTSVIASAIIGQILLYLVEQAVRPWERRWGA